MASLGGQEYSQLRALNLKGSAGLRLEATGGAGTFSVDHLEASRAWSFPDKSGRFSISGTFSVDLTAVAATTFTYSTTVTVTGIRAEDGITVTPNYTSGYSSSRILIGAVPGAGNIVLTFANIGAVGLGEYSKTFGYTAVR